MLKLSVRENRPLGRVTFQKALIARVTTNRSQPRGLRASSVLLSDGEAIDGDDFAAVLYRTEPSAESGQNGFLVSSELGYLGEGDVIRLSPNGHVTTIYRRSANVNFLLVTERCNSFCVMCSQPPREVDDSYLVEDYLKAIPLFDRATREIIITGGEPALLGGRLFELIRAIHAYLPEAAIHVLTNGRNFKDPGLCRHAADLAHPDLMFGIPLYADVAAVHDFVVQADGAFDETIRGLLNLKRHGQKVEIRVVIHRYTADHLGRLSGFIARNLQFVDHVALMGLEPTGFAKSNYADLWIDPAEYGPQLEEATAVLHRAGIRVSVYNHQLCVTPLAVQPFSVRSISDWKREYLPVCDTCDVRNSCGGFFSSAMERHSAHIQPIHQRRLPA